MDLRIAQEASHVLCPLVRAKVFHGENMFLLWGHWAVSPSHRDGKYRMLILMAPLPYSSQYAVRMNLFEQALFFLHTSFLSSFKRSVRGLWNGGGLYISENVVFRHSMSLPFRIFAHQKWTRATFYGICAE